MAQIVSFVDDMTGKAGNDVQTVKYAMPAEDGKMTRYEIDLSVENREAFAKTFAKYVDKSRELAQVGAVSGNAAINGGASNDDVRAWANIPGNYAGKVGSKGRLGSEIIAAYNAAHPVANGSAPATA